MAVVQSYFDPGQPIVGGSAFTQALDLFMQSTRRQNELFLKYNQMPPEQLMERLDQINEQISNLQDEKISQYELMEKTSDYAQKLKLKRESQQYAAINKERKAKFKAAESAADYEKRQNEAIDRRMSQLFEEDEVAEIAKKIGKTIEVDAVRDAGNADELKKKLDTLDVDSSIITDAVKTHFGSDDKIKGTTGIDGLSEIDIDTFVNAYVAHHGLIGGKNPALGKGITEKAKKVTAKNREQGKTGKVKMVRPAYSADVDTDIESIYLEALDMMAPETAAATARNKAIDEQIKILQDKQEELRGQLDPDAGVLIDPLQKFEQRTGGRSTGLLTANVRQAPLRRARRGPTLPEVSLQDRSITVPRPQIEFDPRPVEVPFPEFQRKDKGQEQSKTLDEDIADLVQVEEPPPPAVEEPPPPAVQQSRGVARTTPEGGMITPQDITVDGERREDVSEAGANLSDPSDLSQSEARRENAKMLSYDYSAENLGDPSLSDQQRAIDSTRIFYFANEIPDGTTFNVKSKADGSMYKMKRIGDDLETLEINGRRNTTYPTVKINSKLAKQFIEQYSSGKDNPSIFQILELPQPPEAEVPESEQRYFVQKEADKIGGLGFPTVTVGDTTKPERRQVLEQLTPRTNFEQGSIESFEVQPRTYQTNTVGRRGKVLQDSGPSRIVRRGTDEFEKYQKLYEEAGGQSEQQFRDNVDQIKADRNSPMSEEQLIENLPEDWMKEAVIVAKDPRKFNAVIEQAGTNRRVKLAVDVETGELVAEIYEYLTEGPIETIRPGDPRYDQILQEVKMTPQNKE